MCIIWRLILNIRECFINKFKNKRCHVLGFGTSNRPLAEMLVGLGASVVIHDKNKNIVNEDIYRELSSSGAEFILGEDYLSLLDGDFIFRSPGIRHDLDPISKAVENGACLTSEMELFFEVCPCDIIGITGSDGKTTTTTLTHLLLNAELSKMGNGKAYVGGNIGQPLLPLAEKMSECDVAVVELSSFQLQTMTVSPSKAAITNITPNHLNWHTDFYEYIDAKSNICSHGRMDRLVLNAENDVTLEIAKKADQPIIYFSSKKSRYSDIVPDSKRGSLAVYEDGGVIYVDSGESREGIIHTSDIIHEK